MKHAGKTLSIDPILGRAMVVSICSNTVRVGGSASFGGRECLFLLEKGNLRENEALGQTGNNR